jgi:hypothetical protein
MDPAGRPRNSRSINGTDHPAGARFAVQEKLDVFQPRKFARPALVRGEPSLSAHPSVGTAILPAIQQIYPGLSAYPVEQKDQSCVGFVAAKVIEAQFVREKGNGGAGALNPEFLWLVAQQRDSTPNDPRSGLHDAFSVAVDYGVPPLDDPDGPISRAVKHPLTASELNGRSPSDDTFVQSHLLPMLVNANNRRIESFVTFGSYLEAWKAHLVERGPLGVQFNVTPAFDLVGPKTPPGGASDLPAINLEDDVGELYENGPFDSHAIVFLDFVEGTASADSYFVVLNSYGRGWGNRGFATMTVAQAERSIFRAFGVQLLPIYDRKVTKAS